ncbi:recombination protein RecR [candidate division WWE3 bacterium RIFCSPHIGHO2_01_FULL_42_13]|uniref:Recombination protein RecR n=1 Tax=candidate division WWE3 bacterium RIFCSPHIGHO2_01_FULL_42_13 TaxID=1802617 RepID=A0A1F4UTN4_UNCKA|nr:MAG: recombination protein RecR [candidate division WWE3 bacterium RIFCSPHIGHO2_01_FULL_42_13]
MKIPRPIENLINAFERLPGIGPKTAQRLTFYLLHFPQEELENFASALTNLKTGTKLCSICKNVDEVDPCSICSDARRDKNTIIVTSSPLDVLAFEKVGHKGTYHVLHGVINPLENIGPDEIYIKELISRLKEMVGGGSGGDRGIEIILATNSSMEGESTAMYISKLIRDGGMDEDVVRITRIARGLPVGGDIEYADDITLTRALEGRSSFTS